MSIYYGNPDSEFVYLFFPGWTTTPKDMFEMLKENMDKEEYWCILQATFEKNQWFEYGNVMKNSGTSYESMILNLNLNYKEEEELNTTIQKVSNIVSKIEKNIVLLGTSQGATVAFHYFHSNICSEKIVGLWLHNMAGFYPLHLDIFKKYKYNVYMDNKEGDRHSVFDEDTFSHMRRSLNIITKKRTRNVFFYNSKKDSIVPGKFKNKMIEKLYEIYKIY